MLKKVIPALDVSKLACPGYISISALKNCDPECSYTLADLLNVYLRKFCCPDYFKVFYVVSVIEKWPETTTLSALALFLLKSLRIM